MLLNSLIEQKRKEKKEEEKKRIYTGKEAWVEVF